MFKKYDVDGSVKQYKTSLVAKGYPQIKGVDLQETSHISNWLMIL
jgi:hypothetical protein